MATLYTDQFFVIDPFLGLPEGTAMTVQNYDLLDQDDDGFISASDADTVNGLAVTEVWVGDTVTVVMNGVTVTITGVTFYLGDGTAIFTPTDGTILSDATFVSSTYVIEAAEIAISDLEPACFVRGTKISVRGGRRAVEDLRPGDLVQTLDHGLQPIRWIGCSVVRATARFAPVHFSPGAVGNDVELLVSPQHRLLVQGWRAELHCGCGGVLVPAKHLVDGHLVVRRPCATVVYYHILFDHHEIILSDGALSESFFIGDHALLRDKALRHELLALFPELERGGADSQFRLARTTVKRRDAAVLRVAV
jgi:hypothetical protein